MNDAINILNAVVNALAVALQAVARAALSNIHGAEWLLACALAAFCCVLLLSSGRVWRGVGVMAFLLTVAACAWLYWRLNRHGLMAQQIVLAIMVLHGIRGWTMARGVAK
jgi:uncharacterized membrane protein YhhN